MSKDSNLRRCPYCKKSAAEVQSVPVNREMLTMARMNEADIGIKRKTNSCRVLWVLCGNCGMTGPMFTIRALAVAAWDSIPRPHTKSVLDGSPQT